MYYRDRSPKVAAHFASWLNKLAGSGVAALEYGVISFQEVAIFLGSVYALV
jgi:hypothetical protein